MKFLLKESKKKKEYNLKEKIMFWQNYLFLLKLSLSFCLALLGFSLVDIFITLSTGPPHICTHSVM